MDDAVPGDSRGGDTGATGPDLPGRGLPGDRNGGIVPYLSGEFVKSAAGERAGPAGALHLLVADPARRSAGAVRGRRDGTAGAVASTIAGAVLLREKPLWSGGPGVLELENRNGHGDKAAQDAYEMELTQGGAKTFKQPRNWLQRWWSPDPRKAPRVLTPGLAAYYWNGEAPVAHGIRDISSSGLYVVTEERWYPGTLVLMTLQRNDLGDEMAERSIAVQSRAVRWGPDGVGLQFVLPDEQDRRRVNAQALDAAGRKEFQRFLGQLKRTT